jgi:hypothetical protein
MCLTQACSSTAGVSVPDSLPSESVSVPLVTSPDEHLAPSSHRFLSRGHSQSNSVPTNIFTLPRRCLPSNLLGETGRLRLLHPCLWEHGMYLSLLVYIFIYFKYLK